jgi:hypothetical protein
METESSLPCLQQPTMGTEPEHMKSRPHCRIVYLFKNTNKLFVYLFNLLMPKLV